MEEDNHQSKCRNALQRTDEEHTEREKRKAGEGIQIPAPRQDFLQRRGHAILYLVVRHLRRNSRFALWYNPAVLYTTLCDS
jgi:hypothetical protein